MASDYWPDQFFDDLYKAKQRNTLAEQERDNFKDRLAHTQKFLASGIHYTYQQLAEHDAEVIETWLKRLPVSNRAVRISDVRKSAQDYANQLRQQAIGGTYT